jgi:DNA polymerase
MSDPLRDYYLDMLGVKQYVLRPQVEPEKPGRSAFLRQVKRIDAASVNRAGDQKPAGGGGSAPIASRASILPSESRSPIANSERSGRTQQAIPECSTLDTPALTQMVLQCHACDLCAGRRQPLFGQGAASARLMVVGEAPSSEEDRRATLLVGEEGRLLSSMLFAAGYAPAEVWVTHLLKCAPPGGREPLAEERQSCLPYLKRQIELVQPEVILALGRTVAQSLLESHASLLKLRGSVHSYGDRSIPLVVTFSPAYLIRSPVAKAGAWKDLQQVIERLKLT